MNLTDTPIAVTGATGFLGSHIAEALLTQGAKVRGVVRNPQKGAWLLEKGVTFEQADLRDREALTRAFEGMEAIVSNAALFTMKPTRWRYMYEANLTGTRNVFEAAKDAGVKRIVHISSVAVYRTRLGKVIDEDTPMLTNKHRFIHWNYAVTKSLSEQCAWELSKAYDMDLTVIRPGPIYGPRDGQTTALYQRLMKLWVLPMPTLRLPHVHGGDVARAVVTSLERSVACGKAYNTTGPPVYLPKLLRRWREITGSGPLLFPIPLPFKMEYSNERARIDLDWEPRSLESGLQDTLAYDET